MRLRCNAPCLLTALAAYREERRSARHEKDLLADLRFQLHTQANENSIIRRNATEWMKQAAECRQVRLRLLEELSECHKKLAERQ